MSDRNFTYHVLDIVRGTTVDGPGFRTSVYLSGCSHHCPGCHNPQSWDPHGGDVMTLDEILAVVDEEEFDVTLTGGDPLYNPVSAEALARAVKERGYTVWLYTGYEWDEIAAREDLMKVMRWVDTVVTGRFVEALRDPDLLFRGSANQQLVNVASRIAASAEDSLASEDCTV